MRPGPFLRDVLPRRPRRPRPLIAALLLCSVLAAAGCGKRSEFVDPSTLGPDEVAVASIVPPSRELGLTSPVAITFTHDVAPDTLEPGSYLEKPPAALKPEPRGLWKWSTRRKLEFVPDEPFEPNVRYRLVLDSNLAAHAGLTLRGPRTFDLVAAPFKVVRASVFRERLREPGRRYVIRGSFVFNAPVDPEDFARSFSIDLDRRGRVGHSLESDSISEVMSFRSDPIDADDKDEKVTATVRSGLRPAGGTATLAEDATADAVIPAIERLAIHRVELESREGRRLVRIDVSDEVAASDLENAMSISPPVENLVISSEGQRIYLDGRWQFGTRYEITISSGLASVRGLLLEREFTGSAFMTDLDPWVRISGDGNYLSLRGEQKIAIESVNVDEIVVELDRVYPNNLVSFLHDQPLRAPGDYWRGHGTDLAEVGTNLYRRDVPVASKARNEPVFTPIALADVLAQDSKGIFRLTVRKNDDRGRRDSRWVVATDLGLVVKQSPSELLTAVASIQRLEPLAGVDVKLLSYNNQVIAQGATDAEGLVSFPIPECPEAGDRPFAVVAQLKNDMSFLALHETRIPMGDLDIAGVGHLGSGYEAYVYTDRGIYRPGDTAHLAWILRDQKRRTPDEFPLTLRIQEPEGRTFAEARVTSGTAGAGQYTFEIPDWAPTGPYRVSLHVDDRTVVGHASLRVEEFIPERMKVGVELLVGGGRKDLVHPGDTVRVVATATTLFGPPAAGRKATASVGYSQAPIRFDAWSDFTFGDPDPKRELPAQHLSEQETDAEGRALWRFAPPAMRDFHGWLLARVLVDVTELGGGRSVSEAASTVVSPVDRLIGLRRVRDEASDYTRPGEPVAFEALLVGLDGEPAGGQGTLKVFRRQWRTVLRRDPRGEYRYESEYDEELAEERPMPLEAARNAFHVTVDRNGSYRLVVETGGGSARGSLDFYVYGWGYSPWAMSHPENVRIKLDKESYRAGETLTAAIEAPFPGLLLLTIERERVFLRRWVRLSSNSASVELRLPGGLEPNAYLVATLLRPLDSVEIHAPARAFGATPILMDRTPSTLPVELSVPESLRPRTRLDIRYRVPGVRAGESAKLTIAAVDEGILRVVDFKSPAPLDFFLLRRRLVTASFDIWALLLPEYTHVARRASPGGDTEGAAALEEISEAIGLKGLVSPVTARRVKPAAFWSGIVDGTADWKSVSFELPEFNGTLRVMAVASAGARFGSAEERVRVQDPIVLNPNLPRFLAPGDAITVPVQVFNGIGEEPGREAAITVQLRVDGPVEIAGPDRVTLHIAAGEETVAYFPVRATPEIGAAAFAFTAEGGGERAGSTIELPVRPPQPRDVLATTGVIREGRPVSVPLSDVWYAGSDRATVTVSSLPIAQFGAALAYLLRYPYGCIEQITSRSFPLLYFADIVRELAPDAFGERDADYFVNSGIDYLGAAFIPERGFAFWPGRSSATPNPWVSVYATQFLVEASRKGYVVPEPLLEGTLAYLATLARTPVRAWDESWSEKQKLSARAYAVYVLALAGRPERGAMDFLLQNAAGDLPPESRAHLAGAFGLIGDRTAMAGILPAQDAPMSDERFSDQTFYSPARDDAIRLDVLATVDPENAQIPVLLKRLGDRASGGRWYTTQENGWALLALGKVIARDLAEPASGEILVGGSVVGRFGDADSAESTVVTGEGWAGRTVEIRPDGPGVAYYSVLDSGVPREPVVAPADEGLTVRRAYLDSSGEPIDPARIKAGEVIICRLSLSSQRGRVGNVVVSDLVPAGLEIENPRLVEWGGPEWIARRDPRAPVNLAIEHLDVRDDRLLLFTTAYPTERVFFYGLRAVTAGQFVLPPIRAEAMYDPQVRSVQRGGEITVGAPQ
jgi:hypothetical protein